MKIAVGSDHAGYQLKLAAIRLLIDKRLDFVDVGCNSTDSCDYPDYAKKAAELVASGQCDLGLLFCGTGLGMSIAANKVHGIRACVCSEPYTARLSKQHNNSNIIAFGARVIGIETAKMIVDEWLAATYEGGRHQTRVDMISEIEQTGALRAAEE